jgi:hypothetical protein
MSVDAPPEDTTTTKRRRRSADELLTMLREMQNVHSVELKMMVPGERRAALVGLGLDILRGKIREVWFFDTPDLQLFAAGVVVRARRTQLAADDDTVVKLRPVRPADLPANVSSSPNLKLEMDVTAAGQVISASLKGVRPAGAVRETITEARPLDRLFTKEQRAFFADHVPDGVSWSDLVPLGPAYVVVLKFTPPELRAKMTIEQWHYPGEVPMVELSTKAAPGDILAVYDKAVSFLGSHGLTAEGEQETKTRKALEFYSQQRNAASAPAST